MTSPGWPVSLCEALQPALRRFLRDAGPIDWRADLAESVVPADTARMCAALSIIETDSTHVGQKVCRIGVLRHRPVAAFHAAWLAEEEEHGHALAALGRGGSADVPRPTSNRRRFRDPRMALNEVGTRSLRCAPRVALSTYFVHGAMQEYVAMCAYRHLAAQTRHEGARSVLRKIARQEARHLAFFAAGARHMRRHRRATGVTARLVASMWRPPGLDLLGHEAWRATFRPLLDSDSFWDDGLRLDRLVSTWLGSAGQGLTPMASLRVSI